MCVFLVFPYDWKLTDLFSMRSLVPILNLLDCHESPECQLWAAWAVANLSSYDIHKYAK